MAREKVRWTLSSMATKKFVGPYAICQSGSHLIPSNQFHRIFNYFIVSYLVISSTLLLLLLLSFKSLQLPLLEPFFLKGLREGKCKNINQVINL